MLRVFLLLPAVLAAQTTTPPTTLSKPPVKAATPHAKPAAAHPAAKAPPHAVRPTAPTMTTDDEKTIYALGLSIARSLSSFDLSPHELEIVQQALKDAAAGKPAVELNTWGPKIQPLAESRSAHVAEQQSGLQGLSGKSRRRARRRENGIRLGVPRIEGRFRTFTSRDRHSESELPRHAHQRRRIR